MGISTGKDPYSLARAAVTMGHKYDGSFSCSLEGYSLKTKASAETLDQILLHHFLASCGSHYSKAFLVLQSSPFPLPPSYSLCLCPS